MKVSDKIVKVENLSWKTNSWLTLLKVSYLLREDEEGIIKKIYLENIKDYADRLWKCGSGCHYKAMYLYSDDKVIWSLLRNELINYLFLYTFTTYYNFFYYILNNIRIQSYFLEHIWKTIFTNQQFIDTVMQPQGFPQL